MWDKCVWVHVLLRGRIELPFSLCHFAFKYIFYVLHRSITNMHHLSSALCTEMSHSRYTRVIWTLSAIEGDISICCFVIDVSVKFIKKFFIFLLESSCFFCCCYGHSNSVYWCHVSDWLLLSLYCKPHCCSQAENISTGTSTHLAARHSIHFTYFQDQTLYFI